MLHSHFVAYLIVCHATTSVSSSKQPFQSPFQNCFSFFFNTAISVSSPTKQCPRGESPQNTPRPQTLCVSQTQQRDVADERHLRAAGRQGDIEFLELKTPTSEKKSLVSGISETQENYSCEVNTKISAHTLLGKNNAKKMGGGLPSPHSNVLDNSELQVLDVQKSAWSQNPEVSKYTEKQEQLLLELLAVQCEKKKKVLR